MLWLGAWWLLVAVLVVGAALSARAAECAPPPALRGSFWLVKASPELCLPPLAPYRALATASPEFDRVDRGDGTWHAIGRWTAPERLPTDWSAPSQPWKMLPPGVEPDANGDGIVTLAADGLGFIAAWRDGRDLSADYNGDGIVSVADVRGFLAVVGGQIR